MTQTREGILNSIRINENQLKFYSQQCNKLHCWTDQEWQEALEHIKSCIAKRKVELEEFDKQNQ